MTTQEAIEELKHELRVWESECKSIHSMKDALEMAIKALSAETTSDLYKRGFEDAKRAFELEFAREAESIRKRNAELEVMLNVQKELSAEAETMEKIRVCPVCGFVGYAEDAVKVIRCKDCKYRDDKCGMGEHRWCEILEMSTAPNDFCSCGERKEDDDV